MSIPSLLTFAFGAALASAPGDADDRATILETAAQAGTFDTLAEALAAAGLLDALAGEGPFTVFAPTDEAFAALPEGTVAALLRPESRERLAAILAYHVVPGRVPASAVVQLDAAATLNGQRVAIEVGDGGVRVDGARVVQADVACSNGVIHVVDAVLLPSDDDVLATARAAGSFTTLLAAIEAAGLADTLRGDGPFTVLAPTDAAFAALPEGTVESLLEPEQREMLRAVLTYHVVPGRVFSDAALAARRADTVQGAPVRFRRDGAAVRVNDARVTAADLDARNGVIHVIDAVLMPPADAGAASGARDG